MITKLIEDYIAEVCAGSRNETASAYRSKLRRLENYLLDRDLTQAELDGFRLALLNQNTKRRGARTINEPLSPWTIRTCITTAQGFLRWAERRGTLPHLEIRNIPEPEVAPKACTSETVAALIGAADALESWQRARELALIYMLRDTSCRVGALAALRVDGINWRAKEISSLDKGRYNTYCMLPVTCEALRAWMAERNQRQPDNDYVFLGEKGGQMRRVGIYRAINHLAALVDCTGRHNPHSFRHAFARDAIDNGADLSHVAAMMNHRGGTVVTAKYYARWSRAEIRRAHRKYSPGHTLGGSAKP